MEYDYSKLRGKIIEVYGAIRKFAEDMKWSETTCYNKLNGKIYWKQDEISRAALLLYIPADEVTDYFFVIKVEKCSTF